LLQFPKICALMDAAQLWQLILKAIHFASLVEKTTSMVSLALLDDLDEALFTHFISNPATLRVNPNSKEPKSWCGT
jgi:hypothetical protein